ncbi:MAG: UDP-N-acetylmuramoyl-L-alanine--D-glutamate ligase [Oscillospiraceae bacterium]|nr:UDP-N-acetylmuramoyl-L-alanine--D-glutamate ligase [Oscillospiraceae bacterium]
MTLDEYILSVKDKKIAVIGAGVSNTPLIERLLAAGCSVTVCDKRTAEQMEGEAERLRSLGAELKLGEDYLEDLGQDLIFRTPGLMPFDPHLAAAAARGAVVTSEMELFFRLCPCRIIAVTGSDGKTTTTTIISELLKKEGLRVHLGGNIGHPLLCETPDIRPEDFAVLELSSFQLHSMVCRPNVAVITNLTPNHLDKHRDFQDYIDAKRAICEHQEPGDRLILNQNDDHTPYYASFAKSRLAFFSDKEPVENGACLIEGVLCRVRDGKAVPVVRADEIRIPGEHNVQNYLAAFAATDGLVSEESCRAVARSFAGVEHRLELVRVRRGVSYINDSIASSPTRTIAGLRAMKTKPIVIAGGYDKHIPFAPLGDELCLRAKRVILCGDTADKIREAVLSSENYRPGLLPIDQRGDFRQAVLLAAELAEDGDIVLLSPACAAFDRFRNFAERGRRFKQIVMELPE